MGEVALQRMRPNRLEHSERVESRQESGQCSIRKVDIRLPEKGNAYSHGARPVH